MRVLKRFTFWFNLFLTGLAAAFVIMAIPYKDEARMFPLMIGVPTLIAGIVMLISEWWPAIIKPFDVNVGMSVKVVAQSVEAEETVEGAPPEIASSATRKRILVCAAWMAGYILVMTLAGYNIANFLLPFLYIWIHARTAWWKAFLIAAVTAALMWAMFELLMKAWMWKGLLFGESIPPI